MLDLPTPPEGYELRLADESNQNDLQSFARLAATYHEWLGVDLCFQGFDQEMASLPGHYRGPKGCIVLAYSKRQAADVACVAVRPLLPKHQLHSNNSSSSLHHADKTVQGSNQEEDEQNDLVLDPSTTCEMKRLWVDTAHQKSGLGSVLVSAAVGLARQLGYKHIVLDTLDKLTAANRLYEQAGFTRTSRYNHNPLDGVVFWDKQL